MYYTKKIVNYFYHSFKNKKLIKSNIFKKKNSDNLFILGSGESINSIKIWDQIETHDSVGFNYFIFNNFVPNFMSSKALILSAKMNIMLNYH